MYMKYCIFKNPTAYDTFSETHTAHFEIPTTQLCYETLKHAILGTEKHWDFQSPG